MKGNGRSPKFNMGQQEHRNMQNGEWEEGSLKDLSSLSLYNYCYTERVSERETRTSARGLLCVLGDNRESGDFISNFLANSKRIQLDFPISTDTKNKKKSSTTSGWSRNNTAIVFGSTDSTRPPLPIILSGQIGSDRMQVVLTYGSHYSLHQCRYACAMRMYIITREKFNISETSLGS